MPGENKCADEPGETKAPRSPSAFVRKEPARAVEADWRLTEVLTPEEQRAQRERALNLALK